uniref:Uncharacterized protein n=1 Tax=Glossina brevipalpis TaxID=37001 RepID=A0A1A9WQ82_9MUSC
MFLKCHYSIEQTNKKTISKTISVRDEYWYTLANHKHLKIYLSFIFPESKWICACLQKFLNKEKSGVELPPDGEFKDGCGEVVVGPFLGKLFICNWLSVSSGSISQQRLLLTVFVGYDVAAVLAVNYGDGFRVMNFRYGFPSEFQSFCLASQLSIVAAGAVHVAVIAAVKLRVYIAEKDGIDAGAAAEPILTKAKQFDALVDQC